MKDRPSTSAAVPIMDAAAIQRAVRRVAHEIVERNPDLRSVVLAGIPSRGVEIARRIAEFIRASEKTEIETGIVDVAMHRDDVGARAELPVVRASKLPLPLEGRTLIIVDDVLYTGRTVRAAMDAISSFGRPARGSSKPTAKLMRSGYSKNERALPRYEQTLEPKGFARAARIVGRRNQFHPRDGRRV